MNSSAPRRLRAVAGGKARTASLFDRARALTRLGRNEDAKLAYLELLAQSPEHFGALNNLGALLHDMGYRAAAATAYARAVACHPKNPVGHVNLANALREAGELARAREHCEKALALAPDHAAAHQALAGLLAEFGEEEAAEHHRRLGFGKQQIITLPYHGSGTPISLLLLVSAVGGNIPIRHLLDSQIFRISVIYADYWNEDVALPPHDLVFNTIGDADLCHSALAAAARLLERDSAPVLNPPATVSRSRRTENAIRLARLPGVRTGRTVNLPRTTLRGPRAAEALCEAGLGFPLLLRTPGFHTGRHFLRVESAGELADAVTALPGKELTAIEYLDARGADGNARKYRVMFVNGEILPLHLAVSGDWKVHYFTADMADHAGHRAEEQKFLSDMPRAIGARAMAGLAHIRDALGLDYAGIDFGLNAAGEILLFEANATMVVIAPNPDPRWDYRRAAIARIEMAVRAMLKEKAASRPPLARNRFASIESAAAR